MESYALIEFRLSPSAARWNGAAFDEGKAMNLVCYQRVARRGVRVWNGTLKSPTGRWIQVLRRK